MGDTLRHDTPAYALQQENAPSLEAVRKLTDLGRVPDVLATADVALFDALVLPAHSAWYVVFGTNALVLAYGPRSVGREALTREAWWRVLLRPGLRIGRSDPSLDPSGYRTLMALQLAERHHNQPGLADRLLAAMPPRFRDASPEPARGSDPAGHRLRALALAPTHRAAAHRLGHALVAMMTDIWNFQE